MKNKNPALSKRYLAALRSYLGARGSRRATAAPGLGRDLLASGCDALDVVKMHERSLTALRAAPDVSNARHEQIKSAGKFLAAALAPIGRSQRATQASVKRLQQRAENLRVHRAELAKSNRRLAREVQRRKAGEEAVKQGLAHNRELFVEAQAMQKKLRHLTRQVLSAQEDERREISRELHDDVTQILTAINVELVALGAAPPVALKALRARLTFTQRLAEKAAGAVQQFARDLRPAALDDLGLIPALQTFMETLAAQKKLVMRLTAFAGVEALDGTRRIVLYRVAQEALTNIARHARASTVNMIISEIPGAVRMEVNDNGRSFQVLKTLSSRTNKRLGLLGMRERLEMVGGKLMIESAPGQGTSVRAEIPFSQEAAK